MNRRELLVLVEKVRQDLYRDIFHRGFSLNDKRVVHKSQKLDAILNRYDLLNHKK